MGKDRLIDHNYYQHSETERNMWFNYSDPYFADNEDVMEYQEEIVKNEKSLKNKQKSNNTNVNASKNVYQSSMPDYTPQGEFVQNCNKNNSGVKNKLNSKNKENCDNFKADTEAAINYNSYNGDKTKQKTAVKQPPKVSDDINFNEHKSYNASNNIKSESSHSENSFNLNEKKPKGKKKFTTTISETPIFEPITDVESHTNFNTAPMYAGDNIVASGLKYNNEFNRIDILDDCQTEEITNNKRSKHCDNNAKKQCEHGKTISLLNEEKNNDRPLSTTQDYDFYDTDYVTNFNKSKPPVSDDIEDLKQ